jgi:hypothetical protein
MEANVLPGADTIEFAIPFGSGPHVIAVESDLPAITSPVMIDGYTQPGASPNTLAVGNDADLRIVLTNGRNATVGLELAGGNSTIQGLAINGFAEAKVKITSQLNSIQGNFIGTSVDGLFGFGPGHGVEVWGTLNGIGGLTPAARNLISGNFDGSPNWDGVLLRSPDNYVQGNYIGTNRHGISPVPNGVGVEIRADDNVIGGSHSAAGNVISGNDVAGVSIEGFPFAISGTILRRNLIGIDAQGGFAVGNGIGVIVDSYGTETVIGGYSEGERNVISGNRGDGVWIAGSRTELISNYIGTNAAGTLAVGNGDDGVHLDNASQNLLSGPVYPPDLNPLTGNVISGNSGHGVHIAGREGSGNEVYRNRIGSNATGTAALPNGLDGVHISNSPGNRIGKPAVKGYYGYAHFGNKISSNSGDGVEISGAEAIGNRVQANYIGSNAAYGVHVNLGSSGTTIGGLDAGNVIVRHPYAGIAIDDASLNVIQGNYIGITGKQGGSGDGNEEGVLITGLSSGNVIGGAKIVGSTSSKGNVIAGNRSHGVSIFGTSEMPSANLVHGNFIGTKASGAALGNGGHGVLIFNSPDNEVGAPRKAGSGWFDIPVFYGNTIAHNALDGVAVDDLVFGGHSIGNLISSNSIHSNDGLGIDLWDNGVSQNDGLPDADQGPNNLQNFPVLLGALLINNQTHVATELSSLPGTTFRIEYFRNQVCEREGYGEGATFLGSMDGVTDGSGVLGATAILPTSQVGHWITATATNLTTMDTSEFSACTAVSSASAPPAGPSEGGVPAIVLLTQETAEHVAALDRMSMPATILTGFVQPALWLDHGVPKNPQDGGITDAGSRYSTGTTRRPAAQAGDEHLVDLAIRSHWRERPHTSRLLTERI